MIKVNNLSLGNLSGKIVRDLSFTAPEGRITSLIGKSGSGKTTILRAIAGLNKLNLDGKIEVDSSDIGTTFTISLPIIFDDQPISAEVS